MACQFVEQPQECRRNTCCLDDDRYDRLQFISVFLKVDTMQDRIDDKCDNKSDTDGKAELIEDNSLFPFYLRSYICEEIRHITVFFASEDI